MSDDGLSGRIWIKSGSVHYDRLNSSWEVPICEIKVIGEHTDDHGPYADDYFFVFLTATHSYEASFYAEGRDQVLRALSRALGVKLECGLISSTTFNSRVMWPSKLGGQALYDFVPGRRGKGLWKRFKDAIVPLVEYQLADGVKAEVKGD